MIKHIFSVFALGVLCAAGLHAAAPTAETSTEETALLAIEAGKAALKQRAGNRALTEQDQEMMQLINVRLPEILNTIRTDFAEVETQVNNTVSRATELLLAQQTQYPDADKQATMTLFKDQLLAGTLAENDSKKLKAQPALLTEAAAAAIETYLTQKLERQYEEAMNLLEQQMNARPSEQDQEELKQSLMELLPAEMLQELKAKYGEDFLDKFVKMTPQEQMDFIMQAFQEQQKSQDQSFHHRKAEQDFIYQNLQGLNLQESVA